MDYPDTAASAAVAVARGEADAAIVIDGAGLGSTIAANKVPGARAAMCLNGRWRAMRASTMARTCWRLAQRWSTGDNRDRRYVPGHADARARYIRRLAKIRDLERYPRS